MDQTNRHSASELIKWQKPTLNVLEISKTKFSEGPFGDGEGREDVTPPQPPPRS